MKTFTDIKLRFIISPGGCGLICKYILIVFNIVFAVAGFASLVFGLWLHSLHNTKEIYDIGSAKDNKEGIELKVFNIAVYILVTLGSIMAAMGIIGEYAACNGKKIALLMFSILVFLLAVGEITIGVLAYSSRHEVGKKLEVLYKDVHQLYVKNEDEAVATILMFLHSLLHCCGLTGFQHTELIKKTCQKLDHSHSCSGRVGAYFDSKAPLVLGFFVGTGVILIVEGICSSLLSSKIDQDATALE